MPPKKAVVTSSQVELAADIPEQYKDLSTEELERLIAQANLQTQLLELDRVKADNATRLAKKAELLRHNKQLQQDMETQEALTKSAQARCRHRMGGNHRDVYNGQGIPCIVRTQMLDGYTYLLLCTRCRLKVFTPHPSLKQSDPARYAADKAEFDRLWQMSLDAGLDEIRGPSFIFERDGVPFIPMRA